MSTREPLTVWLFPSAYAPHIGGIERVTADLVEGLRNRGHMAVIVTNRYPDDLAAYENIDGTSVFRFAWPSPSRKPAALLKAAINGVRTMYALRKLPIPAPDIVHVHGLSSHNPFALAIAKFHNAPLLLTTHGELNSSRYQPGRDGTWSRLWTRRVVGRADRVLAPASGVITDAADVGVPLPTGTRVLANGIDPNGWVDVPLPAAMNRGVGAWGRLSPEKGFDRLLDVWPAVRAVVPDATLWLAGTGPEHDDLARRLTPGARLVGPCTKDELCSLLVDTKVAVIPSRHEPFGLVGLEAVVAGRTVLYARSTGLEEAVGDHGTAIDCGDPDPLARAIIDALQRPVPSNRPSVRTTEDMVVDTIAVYDELLMTTQAKRRRRSGRGA